MPNCVSAIAHSLTPPTPPPPPFFLLFPTLTDLSRELHMASGAKELAMLDLEDERRAKAARESELSAQCSLLEQDVSGAMSLLFWLLIWRAILQNIV